MPNPSEVLEGTQAYIGRGRQVHEVKVAQGSFRFVSCKTWTGKGTTPTDSPVTCKLCLREIKRREAANGG